MKINEFKIEYFRERKTYLISWCTQMQHLHIMQAYNK